MRLASLKSSNALRSRIEVRNWSFILRTMGQSALNLGSPGRTPAALLNLLQQVQAMLTVFGSID